MMQPAKLVAARRRALRRFISKKKSGVSLRLEELSSFCAFLGVQWWLSVLR
jgi:hypothetical protein